MLTGAGRHSQAGADLHWIKKVRRQSEAENVAASRQTFETVQRKDRLPIPTVALLQGARFGGGIRMKPACDVVIAADNFVMRSARARSTLCIDGRALRCRGGPSYRPRA